MALAEADLIVLAAGSGLRARAPVPKQFASAPAREGATALRVLTSTLMQAERARLGGRTVVAVPAQWMAEGREAAATAGLPGAEVIAGGPGRLASLHLAAEHLSRDRGPDQVVVVHDGTRPFTPPDLFTTVVAALAEHDAAWPAAPIANAVLARAAIDDRWTQTPSSDLLACGTPIATRLTWLLRAMAERTSDEGALVGGLLAAGLDWAPVPDSPLNFKVTSERDLHDTLRVLGTMADGLGGIGGSPS